MPTQSFEQTLTYMKKFIHLQVKAGFKDADLITSEALEVCSDYHPSSMLTSYAKTFVQEAMLSHLKEQTGWEVLTDCDRLDNAFGDLERHGIISRQDFSCCNTCGSDEIVDEVIKAKKEGRSVHGYVFYHMQDTEHAVNGHGLYLSYGSIMDDVSQRETVEKIMKTLEEHGLRVEWDGSFQTRIFVQMNWKRRRL